MRSQYLKVYNSENVVVGFFCYFFFHPTPFFEKRKRVLLFQFRNGNIHHTYTQIRRANHAGISQDTLQVVAPVGKCLGCSSEKILRVSMWFVQYQTCQVRQSSYPHMTRPIPWTFSGYRQWL